MPLASTTSPISRWNAFELRALWPDFHGFRVPAIWVRMVATDLSRADERGHQDSNEIPKDDAARCLGICTCDSISQGVKLRSEGEPTAAVARGMGSPRRAADPPCPTVPRHARRRSSGWVGPPHNDPARPGAGSRVLSLIRMGAAGWPPGSRDTERPIADVPPHLPMDARRLHASTRRSRIRRNERGRPPVRADRRSEGMEDRQDVQIVYSPHTDFFGKLRATRVMRWPESRILSFSFLPTRFESDRGPARLARDDNPFRSMTFRASSVSPSSLPQAWMLSLRAGAFMRLRAEVAP
jgi:hypothetical protein